ncbi:MAG: hypothetical protein RR585_00805, partial [Coprobacillus sp.]
MISPIGINKIYAYDEVSNPEVMQPNTIIEYISNTEYIVLSGGESKQAKLLPPTLEGTILEGKVIDESNYIVE